MLADRSEAFLLQSVADYRNSGVQTIAAGIEWSDTYMMKLYFAKYQQTDIEYHPIDFELIAWIFGKISSYDMFMTNYSEECEKIRKFLRNAYGQNKWVRNTKGTIFKGKWAMDCTDIGTDANLINSTCRHNNVTTLMVMVGGLPIPVAFGNKAGKAGL